MSFRSHPNPTSSCCRASVSCNQVCWRRTDVDGRVLRLDSFSKVLSSGAAPTAPPHPLPSTASLARGPLVDFALCRVERLGRHWYWVLPGAAGGGGGGGRDAAWMGHRPGGADRPAKTGPTVHDHAGDGRGCCCCCYCCCYCFYCCCCCYCCYYCYSATTWWWWWWLRGCVAVWQPAVSGGVEEATCCIPATR